MTRHLPAPCPPSAPSVPSRAAVPAAFPATPARRPRWPAAAVLAAAVLAGCAAPLPRSREWTMPLPQLRNEVAQLQAQRHAAQQRHDQAAQWLQRDSQGAFDGQVCRAPPHGPRPPWPCPPPEQERNTALALCAMGYKGCDVVLAQLKDQLNSRDKRFLASQACQALVAQALEQKRGVGAMLYDMAEDAARHGCKQGSFFGCLLSRASEAVRLVQFAACVDERAGRCQRRYEQWRDAPAQALSACQARRATLHGSREELARLDAQLAPLRQALAQRQRR